MGKMSMLLIATELAGSGVGGVEGKPSETPQF